MKLTAFIIAILGYYINGTKHKWISYILWIISNSTWAYLTFKDGNNMLGWMFVVYNIFCIYNLIKIKYE